MISKHVERRVIDVAYYFIATKKTIRQLAKEFDVSKSTIHKDLNERLTKVKPSLSGPVRNILEAHIKERHINGGESTRKRWIILKEQEEKDNEKIQNS